MLTNDNHCKRQYDFFFKFDTHSQERKGNNVTVTLYAACKTPPSPSTAYRILPTDARDFVGRTYIIHSVIIIYDR